VLLADPQQFKLLIFALSFLKVEGLNLLLTDDKRALIHGDLTVQHRRGQPGNSLGRE
jgi:hypothetical protein